MATVDAGGSVLIPVDAAGRGLELAYALDEQWSIKRCAAPLVLLCDCADRLMEYAATLLEFCTPSVSSAFALK